MTQGSPGAADTRAPSTAAAAETPCEELEPPASVPGPTRSGSRSKPAAGPSRHYHDPGSTSASSSPAPAEALSTHEAEAASGGAPQNLKARDAAKHTKTHHIVMTEDGWRLHMVRTQQVDLAGSRRHPVLLVPGLGSSGVYTFDLSPVISFADWLASRGWDVWIAELRGNGESDKPSLVSGRSRWWTIDDYVALDIPAVLRYVCARTRCPQLHVMAHSMGGMIVARLLTLNGAAATRLRSVTLIGSSPFLKGSRWQAIEPLLPAARLLWAVPAGAAVRLYSMLAFSRLAISYVDQLYWWPDNVEPALGRVLLARNFSSISPGVILQFCTAFQTPGVMTADLSEAFGDAERMAQVKRPVLYIVGDRDRMCPPWGCKKAFDLLGSPDKQFVCLGPKNGQTSHYGHFDILMGKHAEVEVFPKLQAWLESHDEVEAESTACAQEDVLSRM